MFHLGLEIWPFLGDILDADSGNSLNAEGKLGRAPALDARDPSSNAIVVQVCLGGGSRVYVFDLRLVEGLAIFDEKLTVGTDEGGSNRDAGDGDGVNALVRTSRGGTCVDVGEEGGYIGTRCGHWDALGDAREDDGAPGEGYHGKSGGLRAGHG